MICCIIIRKVAVWVYELVETHFNLVVWKSLKLLIGIWFIWSNISIYNFAELQKLSMWTEEGQSILMLAIWDIKSSEFEHYDHNCAAKCIFTLCVSYNNNVALTSLFMGYFESFSSNVKHYISSRHWSFSPWLHGLALTSCSLHCMFIPLINLLPIKRTSVGLTSQEYIVIPWLIKILFLTRLTNQTSTWLFKYNWAEY